MKNHIVAKSLSVLIAAACFTCRTHERDRVQNQLIIDTLKFGDFVEWIPQTGTVNRDTLDGVKVVVPIDEFYLPKISKGLKAIASFDKKEFQLRITYIYPEIHNGTFQVAMNFVGKQPEISTGKDLRLKILLSEPAHRLLLPQGNFYSDTQGEWIFVVQDNRAIKRAIKLGRKSSDYFEVIAGLDEGDKVITSSYQLFKDHDKMDVSDIQDLLK